MLAYLTWLILCHDSILIAKTGQSSHSNDNSYPLTSSILQVLLSMHMQLCAPLEDIAKLKTVQEEKSERKRMNHRPTDTPLKITETDLESHNFNIQLFMYVKGPNYHVWSDTEPSVLLWIIPGVDIMIVIITTGISRITYIIHTT